MVYNDTYTAYVPGTEYFESGLTVKGLEEYKQKLLDDGVVKNESEVLSYPEGKTALM